MEYVVLNSQWGGLSYVLDPTALGPGRAQESRGIDYLSGTLRNRFGDTTAATAATVRSAYNWNDTVITDTDPYVYFEYGGRLIRMRRCCGTREVPMYSTDGSTWHALGLRAPGGTITAAVSANAGNLNGTYRYYATFYNAYGDESSGSPVSNSVSPAAREVNLTTIPYHQGRGDVTNGSNIITNVENPSEWRVGQGIVDASNFIPAGTTITEMDTSAATITMSANATNTGTVFLQDPQWTGRRIYREGGGLSEARLVTSIANMTATTYTDNVANADLGDAMDTKVYTFPPAMAAGGINPDGVMMGLLSEEGSDLYSTTLAYCEIGAPHRYLAGSVIDIPERGFRVFQAFNRFHVLTSGEVLNVIGTDGSNFELVNTGVYAPVTAADANSDPGAPVVMPDGVWIASLIGVVNYTLSDAQVLTRDVLGEAANANVGAYCKGACRLGERYLLLYDHDGASDYRILVFDPKVPGGWHFLDTAAYTDAGALINGGGNPPRAILYANSQSLQLELPSNARKTGAVYWMGNWRGQRLSFLKRVRDVDVLHNGDITVQVFVDNASVAGPTAFSKAALGVSRLRLKAGIAGRVVSVKLTLTSAAAQVLEVGAHVGKEQEQHA